MCCSSGNKTEGSIRLLLSVAATTALLVVSPLLMVYMHPDYVQFVVSRKPNVTEVDQRYPPQTSVFRCGLFACQGSGSHSFPRTAALGEALAALPTHEFILDEWKRQDPSSFTAERAERSLQREKSSLRALGAAEHSANAFMLFVCLAGIATLRITWRVFSAKDSESTADRAPSARGFAGVAALWLLAALTISMASMWLATYLEYRVCRMAPVPLPGAPVDPDEDRGALVSHSCSVQTSHVGHMLFLWVGGFACTTLAAILAISKQRRGSAADTQNSLRLNDGSASLLSPI